jgi:hypothetical protein
MEEARMLLRWLLRYALLSIAHGLTSFVAFFLMYAAAMSPGGGWLVDCIGYVMFFPLLVLDCAGIDLGTLDNPLAIAVNSLIWAGIVSVNWLAASHLRHRKPDNTPCDVR